jgi:two-component system LytT family response regulator
MKKINAVLIDDEPGSLEALRWELEPYKDELAIKAACTSAAEGIGAIRREQPDLVFLDIEMPHTNGFELLRQVSDLRFDVVFTTAYDEFAVQAFKVNALDYLLKPIDEDELRSALEKVRHQRQKPLTQERLEGLFQALKQQDKAFPSVALPTLEGLEFVEVKDILYCQADGNYTRLAMAGGELVLVSKTLKEVEGMLEGHHFFRVHHSFFVHLIHVKKYVRGKGGHLVLKNGESIPVSRGRKDDLLGLF